MKVSYCRATVGKCHMLHDPGGDLESASLCAGLVSHPPRSLWLLSFSVPWIAPGAFWRSWKCRWCIWWGQYLEASTENLWRCSALGATRKYITHLLFCCFPPKLESGWGKVASNWCRCCSSLRSWRKWGWSWNILDFARFSGRSRRDHRGSLSVLVPGCIAFLFVVFLPLLLGFLFSHLSFCFEASFVCAMFVPFVAFLFWFLALFLILSAGFKEVYIHESRSKAGTEPYLSAERCCVVLLGHLLF